MPKNQDNTKIKNILENIMYSKQVFVIWTLFRFISVFLLAALLKFEITVSFRTKESEHVENLVSVVAAALQSCFASGSLVVLLTKL